MIYYRTEAWLQTTLRFSGTVLQTIWWKVALVMSYVVVGYGWCMLHEQNLGKLPKNVLGSMLSFLLVFRANSAYSRYWVARSLVTEVFCALREFATLGLSLQTGGRRNYLWRWRHVSGLSLSMSEDDDQHTDGSDRIVSEERTDLLRWTLIVALAMQMHLLMCDQLQVGELDPKTRRLVDWCRYRVRCLTTGREFQELDRHVRALAMPQAAWEDGLAGGDLEGAAQDFDAGGRAKAGRAVEVATMPRIRLPVVAMFRLLKVIIRNANDTHIQDRKYGITERFVSLFTRLGSQVVDRFGLATQIITTPLPFPYFHLCRVLLFVYFMSFPLFIEWELGLWGNVGELSLLCIALLGIDAIGTELENPFGQDLNDLDVWERVAMLEQELFLFAQLSGDSRLQSNFVWQETPAEISGRCICPVLQHLALREQVESNGKSKDFFHGGRTHRETFETEDVDVEEDVSDDS